MSLPNKYPTYDVRSTAFGIKVRGAKHVHDGDGKIFIVGQIELPGDGHPKGCQIWLANNDGSLTPLTTIKEIYDLPMVYIRADGLAIVQGMDHALLTMHKVNIPEFTPRPDMMLSTWTRWLAYFGRLLGRVLTRAS